MKENEIKRMQEYSQKMAIWYENHKDDYIEINKDNDSILKIYERKNKKHKWYQTLYMLDNELLEKKCNKFVEDFKNGKTHYEDSILNIGLILSHLSNKNDGFSQIAQAMYNDMYN